MTLAENRVKRSREAIAILSEREPGEAMRRPEVWATVIKRVPLELDEESLDARKRSRGFVAWINETTTLVRAGWLEKSGSGEWRATAAGRRALDDFPDPHEFLREARARYASWSRAKKEEQSKLLATVIVPFDADQERLHASFEIFVDRGLVAGDSVFVPGREVWTAANAQELVERFVDVPDAAGGSFIDKLTGQLENASDDARLLMAELVCWQLIPISTNTIGSEKKRNRVEDVLAMMEHPVQIPDVVSDVFDTGSFAPGTRMSSNLFAAMSIIVSLVADWCALSDEEREVILDDPWRWRAFVLSIAGEAFPTQRNSLMYCGRPDYFGRVVAGDAKTAIRDAFIGEISTSSGDLERDLFDITIALQIKAGAPVNFYEEKYRRVWQPQADPVRPDPEPDPDDPEQSASSRNRFPRATAAFAASVYVDEPWLQRTLDLLERRRQVILYGPPGTGKTFLARELAAHISASGEAETTKLVQFHPSYSYEDFFEGYRPVTVNGTLSYELVGGPMRRIADRARANPELNFVLIIDEINRGNLAKIFGELYFLLEYRDQSVELLYGKDVSFTLPSNVFINCTMNTSDRSIALMDAAMRRRFAFVQLHPSLPPTSGVLSRWLDSHALSDEPARLLAALNARITDPAFQVGPSYLMNGDLNLSENRLAEIWDYEVLPLLEELHFGEDVDIDARYGLTTLRRALRREVESSESALGDVEGPTAE